MSLVVTDLGELDSLWSVGVCNTYDKRESEVRRYGSANH